MRQIDKNVKAFLALVSGGLWGKEVFLSQYGESDYPYILRLANEQSVIGLVTAGLDHVTDVQIPYEVRLTFVGSSSQIERRNAAMNSFIAALVDKIRHADIYALLVKGQGIAQCYERPLWRSCGDVDLLLDEANYEKAKRALTPLASSVETEGRYKKHIAMHIDHWLVELHGNMRCGLSTKMDKELDAIHREVFTNGDVRCWMNGKTQVFLPDVNSDALFVFTHFIKHFYTGGLGLKQVCDWCRIVWTYRDKIDKRLLEDRLRRMGLMSEWIAFGVFAVEYLGMPPENMPFYKNDTKWLRKADKICTFIITVGNFGQNRGMSNTKVIPYLVRKIRSFGYRCCDVAHHARIFPVDSFRFFPKILFNGVWSAAKGE